MYSFLANLLIVIPPSNTSSSLSIAYIEKVDEIKQGKAMRSVVDDIAQRTTRSQSDKHQVNLSVRRRTVQLMKIVLEHRV